ncbi:MAG: peptidylprolyl isomerase [Endozoicomonas sp.]
MKLVGQRLLAVLLLMAATCTMATGLDKPSVDETQEVVLDTNKGQIIIRLAESTAPITVKNFLNYVENGFYDGLVFHRVIKDFMIQGGGFTEDMTQKKSGTPIKNESMQRGRLENKRGTLAMARTQVADSATSQFFINLKDNHFLDGQSRQPGYAVFGEVTQGMDVVDQIATVRTGYRGSHGDVPVDPVIIKKAYLLSDELTASNKKKF